MKGSARNADVYKRQVLDGGRLLAVDGPENIYASGMLNRVFGVELGRVMTDRGWRYYYL